MDLPFQVNDSIEALRHALGSAKSRRVFLEDRVQARISAAPGGAFELVPFRVVGAAIEGERTVHLSDPGLHDLGGPAKPRVSLARLLPEPELSYPRWLGLVREMGERGWNATLVEFHQKVWVAVEGEVWEDVRTSARLEIASPTMPGAALDLVLRAGVDVTPDVLGASLDDRTRRRTRAVPVAAADASATVFGPGVAGLVAHELIGHALEGDVALDGTRLSRHTGAFAPQELRVIDDPSRGRAPWTIDDEGTHSRAVTLVANGRVEGRLHDEATARRCGETSTGHGRCGGYLDPILPRMGCTYIDGGNTRAGSIVPDTPRGIFIRRMAGAHADPSRGRATFVVTDADRIEGGELTDSLEPFAIELDAIDALASIDRIGDDLAFDTCIGSCVRSGQPLATSVGAPTVRLRVIRVIS